VTINVQTIKTRLAELGDGFWDKWRGLLDNDPEVSPLEVASDLWVDVSRVKKYEDVRETVLQSEHGRVAWEAYVEALGFRDDEISRRVVRLALTFPTVADACERNELVIAAQGWSAPEVERFACRSAAATSGSRHACAFLLGVWSNAYTYACGRFDVHKALATWDDEHRAAFLSWAQAPWWA
jgi:hypothetical protein